MISNMRWNNNSEGHSSCRQIDLSTFTHQPNIMLNVDSFVLVVFMVDVENSTHCTNLKTYLWYAY